MTQISRRVVTEKSNRRFSKWMVGLNSLLSWVAIIYSIKEHESAYVAAPALAFLLGIGAYYMNIGHRDLKEMMSSVNAKSTEADISTYNGPAMPEPTEDK